MTTETLEAEIYAVIQFGGSTEECYLHSFRDERSALAYMRRAKRASYRCIGPFEISLAAEGRLARAAENALGWMKARNLSGGEPFVDLEGAIRDVRKGLSYQ